MLSKTVSLLALSAAVAVAKPYGYSHSHFHHSSLRITGSSSAQSTGGEGSINSTETGYSGSGSLSVLTTTVSPAATSTTVTAIYASDVTVEESSTASLSASAVVSSVVAAAAYGSNGNTKSYAGRTSTTLAASVATSAAASSSTIAYTSAGTSAASSVSVASSAAASATSSSSSGSSSGGKMGLSYNTASLLSLFSGSGASWAYDWALAASGSMPSGVEYVPMCWGQKTGVPDISTCASTMTAAGASHVLSFNEPDYPTQANMSPDLAVTNHISALASKLSSSVKIGSPGVTSSETAGQGLDWLQSFLTKCAGNCNIDFLAIHWYGEASADATFASTFKAHVDKAVAMAQDPANHVASGKVWVTEFANTGTDAQNAAFVTKAKAYLDSNAGVERYAYFMVGPESGGLGMVSGSSLNVVGQAYAS